MRLFILQNSCAREGTEEMKQRFVSCIIETGHRTEQIKLIEDLQACYSSTGPSNHDVL